MRDETAEQPAPLRSGLTTGSCATATSLAAARLLLGGVFNDAVQITLPKGKQVQMRLEFCRLWQDRGMSALPLPAPTDAELREILSTTRVVACVGVSPNPVRPSHYVARYLTLKGFRVIPVNPGHAGETLFGETVAGLNVGSQIIGTGAGATEQSCQKTVVIVFRGCFRRGVSNGNIVVQQGNQNLGHLIEITG